jgi:hypothetical protein
VEIDKVLAAAEMETAVDKADGEVQLSTIHVTDAHSALEDLADARMSGVLLATYSSKGELFAEEIQAAVDAVSALAFVDEDWDSEVDPPWIHTGSIDPISSVCSVVQQHSVWPFCSCYAARILFIYWLAILAYV